MRNECMVRFSIVITATRPDVVASAVRSALAQDFNDVEIIVSDNSDAGCRELIDFTDGRLRCVRPPRYLPLVDHWNFAFSHAVGEWQMLLCDDFAILPSLLTILDEEIKRNRDVDTLIWGSATYVDEDWWIADQRGYLTIPSFTGRRVKLDSRSVIAEMFKSGTGLAGPVKQTVPIMANAMYSRRIIARIRQRLGGSLFEPICPMTSAALIALALSNYTLRIDLPLVVKGSHRNSAAGNFADPTTYHRMLAGMNFRHIPLKTAVLFPCTAAETVLHMQSILPDLIGAYRLNWANFFANCYAAIRELEGRGLVVDDVRKLFRMALRLSPFFLRIRVWGAILSHHARSLVLLQPLRRFRRTVKREAEALSGVMNFGQRASAPQRLDVRRIGLNNITDCVSYVECLLSDQREMDCPLGGDTLKS